MLPGCLTCLDGSSCSKCIADEYYLDDKHQCIKCSTLDNCKSCQDKDTCTDCIENYFPYEGICKTCDSFIPECEKCNSKS